MMYIKKKKKTRRQDTVPGEAPRLINRKSQPIKVPKICPKSTNLSVKSEK